MNTKNFVLLSVIVIISALLLVNNGYAENDFAETNVSVSVAAQTWIDISPDKIRWESVNPGAKSTSFKDLETDVTGIEGFNIRNIGSNNISRIWFNASYASASNKLYEDIYNTNDLTKYDTGNFISLSKPDCTGNPDAKTVCGGSTITDNDYFYPNKVEYAEAVINDSNSVTNGSMIPYLNLTKTKNVTTGRIRDGKNEYFWAIYAPAGEGWNCSIDSTNPPIFVVGKNPHNDTNVGSIDLRSGSSDVYEKSLTTTTTDSLRGITMGDSDGRWKSTTVSVSADCKMIKVIQWNKDFAISGDNKNYWITSSATSAGQAYADTGWVLPGEYYTAWTYLQLPYGVPDGTMTAGTLTVLAS